MRKGITLPLTAIVALSSWTCACAGDNNLAGEIKAVTDEVHGKIAQFQRDKSWETEPANAYPKTLWEVNESIDDLHSEWERNPALVGSTILRLKLEVLEACFMAQDKTYDIKNPPPFSTVASPGLGPDLWSGMKPEDVKDPVIRKRYEEAIVENNRRKAKHMRESELQYLNDYLISDIRGHLTGRKLETLRQDVAIIKKTIKNPGVMKKIREEVLADLCDENGALANK